VAARRRSRAAVLAGGLLIQGVALLMIAVAIGALAGLLWLAAMTAVFGLGHVIGNAGTALGVAATPLHLHGAAAGLVATLQNLGAAVGPLILVGEASAGRLALGMAAAGACAILGGTLLSARSRRAAHTSGLTPEWATRLSHRWAGRPPPRP
jgi:hypothetical protein